MYQLVQAKKIGKFGLRYPTSIKDLHQEFPQIRKSIPVAKEHIRALLKIKTKGVILQR